MKKFTDTQKKWALTATMIAALGCSVSFNSQHTANFSADLASEAEEDLMVPTKVTIDKKDIKVRLVRLDDKQTTVLVSPQKDAEGKILFECGDCSTFVLNKKLRKDEDTIAEFQDEVIKKLMATSKEVVKEASVVTEDSENRGRRKRSEAAEEIEDRDGSRRKSALNAKEQRNLLYADGDKSCVKKDGEEKFSGVEQSKCYANAFTASLKKNEIDPIIAIHYYKKEIEPSLVNEIARGTFYDEFGVLTENKGLKVVANLMRTVPEEQISLKEQLVFTSTQALNKRAAAVRNLINSSRTATGGISQAASMRYHDLVATSQILFQSNNDMVLASVDSNVGQIILENAYAQPTMQIIGSLPQLGNQPQFLNGRQINQQQLQGVVAAPGYNNQQNGRTVYGNQTQYQLQAPNSFALEGMSPAGVVSQNQLQPVYENGMLIAPTADQVINSNQQSIVVLPQNTANGVQFGTPRGVSPQALQEAQRIRAQQGQRIWVQQ